MVGDGGDVARTADSTPHPHQATAYGTAITGLAYDLNGNRVARTKGGVFECYAFNPLDRLVQVKTAPAAGCASPTRTISYAYDHAGRRVLKVPQASDGGPIRYFSPYFESQGGVVTKHYYVGGRRIASQTKTLAGYSELPPGFVVPRDFRLPGALVLALGVALLLLLLAPDRRRNPWPILTPLPGRALALAILLVGGNWPTRAAACGPTGDPAYGVQFYHVDHLGSTLAMTDAGGNLFRQVRYTAYGDIRGRFDAGAGTLPAAETKRHEFTTYETEPETGLQYAHARIYDPALAQFLSHDPAAEFASPYQYTGYDPVNASDPTGAIELLAVLFWIGLALVAARAIQVWAQTGSFDAALVSLAVGIVGIAVGSMIGGALISDLAPALGLEAATLQQALGVVGLGAGGYGVASGIESGDALAIVGGVLAIVGAAYALSQPRTERAASAAPNEKRHPLPVEGIQPAEADDHMVYEFDTDLGEPAVFALPQSRESANLRVDVRNKSDGPVSGTVETQHVEFDRYGRPLRPTIHEISSIHLMPGRSSTTGQFEVLQPPGVAAIVIVRTTGPAHVGIHDLDHSLLRPPPRTLTASRW